MPSEGTWSVQQQPDQAGTGHNERLNGCWRDARTTEYNQSWHSSRIEASLGLDPAYQRVGIPNLGIVIVAGRLKLSCPKES